ncbi:MAG TPA: undecaprenyldiphospho-muramoylpentapeptide beta-N-acetylglucosaminyltransferase [Bacteroidales bacterium]|nr:undecaprenyldiphospho-muramoylpentapeptide beta-N-acetylglucosaminyltransferase [Bacteroidales bacterium]
MSQQKHRKVIISGGGTGGHIFPAISIANALKKLDPTIEILFVGAEGRMEMEKVPAAGYRIVGLPVAGLYRSLTPKNIKVLFRLVKSLFMARKILKEFSPDVVVGVGGYASGPVLRQAGKMNIPTLIQEQNSYAGVTNKLLAKKASRICVAYEGMEKYFPAEKIMNIGNPVRGNFEDLSEKRDEAMKFFGLKPEFPVVLILGGSLGAGSINNSLVSSIDKLSDSDCQWLWQTGKYYYTNVVARMTPAYSSNIKVHDFINRMDYAYAAADVIVSRAGAGTISELCLVGKPVILVPSPNVAEDHQTKNAKALSERGAAVFISDSDAPVLVDESIKLVADFRKRRELSSNIQKLAQRDSDIKIALEVLKLAMND